MRRLGFLTILLFAFALPGLAQTAVTAHLFTGLTQPATTGQVCFHLKNYGTNIPHVVGTGVVAQTDPPCLSANTNGLVTGTIYGSDVIAIGACVPSSGNPCTYWTVEYWVNGQLQSSADYSNIVGASVLLDSLTPMSTLATVPAPTGDSTYVRKDGGNVSGSDGFLAAVGAALSDNISNNGGLYLMSAFRGDGAGNESLWLDMSYDKTTFAEIDPEAIYSPTSLRDPSILEVNTATYPNGYCYAYTTVAFTSGTTFGVACSPNFLTTPTLTANVPAMTSYSSNPYAWAPEWTPSLGDGLFHVLVSASPDYGNTFSIAETHASSPDAAAGGWSTPVAVTGTSLPARMIDPFLVVNGSTYYLFFVNTNSTGACAGTEAIELATSTSPFSGYTVVGSSNWAGWGCAHEGESVVHNPDGTWSMFYDDWSLTSYRTMRSDSASLTSGWSAPVVVSAPHQNRHGTVIYTTRAKTLTDASAAAFAYAAQSSPAYSTFQKGATFWGPTNPHTNGASAAVNAISTGNDSIQAYGQNGTLAFSVGNQNVSRFLSTSNGGPELDIACSSGDCGLTPGTGLFSGTATVSINTSSQPGNSTWQRILQVTPAGLLNIYGANSSVHPSMLTLFGNGANGANYIASGTGVLSGTMPLQLQSGAGTAWVNFADGLTQFYGNKVTIYSGGYVSSVDGVSAAYFNIPSQTTTGHVLRNNGVNYVDSAIQAADLPASVPVKSGTPTAGAGVCWKTSTTVGTCTAGTWPNCSTCN